MDSIWPFKRSHYGQQLLRDLPEASFSLTAAASSKYIITADKMIRNYALHYNSIIVTPYNTSHGHDYIV